MSKPKKPSDTPQPPPQSQPWKCPECGLEDDFPVRRIDGTLLCQKCFRPAHAELLRRKNLEVQDFPDPDVPSNLYCRFEAIARVNPESLDEWPDGVFAETRTIRHLAGQFFGSPWTHKTLEQLTDALHVWNPHTDIYGLSLAQVVEQLAAAVAEKARTQAAPGDQVQAPAMEATGKGKSDAKDGADHFLDFTGKQRALLTALADKGKVAIADVLKAVYESKAAGKLEALLKLKVRTNKTLTSKRPSLEIKKDDETLILAPV
jgi:hypothetical protein